MKWIIYSGPFGPSVLSMAWAIHQNDMSWALVAAGIWFVGKVLAAPVRRFLDIVLPDLALRRVGASEEERVKHALANDEREHEAPPP